MDDVCFQVFFVFVLYVWCIVINFVDLRIMIYFLLVRDIFRSFNEFGSQLQFCFLGVLMSFIFVVNFSVVRGFVGDDERVEDFVIRKFCYNFLVIFCCVFVFDDCWKQEEEQGNSRVGLYCMLCNCEV